jgi:predicted nucleic acid-binding protein
MTIERAAEALDDYLILPVIRHGHLRFLGRILTLRHNFSAYDACYVSLAESLGAALVTAASRLAESARRHLELEVVGTEATD